MALIGEDGTSCPLALDALGDFYGLTLDTLGDFCELTLDACWGGCRLYRSYDLISRPNHRVALIGEDNTSCPVFIWDYSFVGNPTRVIWDLRFVETLHGLHDFSFVRGSTWVNPLDLLRGVLMKFGLGTLHGLSCFDPRRVLVETLRGLHELRAVLGFHEHASVLISIS